MTASEQPIGDQGEDWEAGMDEEFAPPPRRRFPFLTGGLARSVRTALCNKENIYEMARIGASCGVATHGAGEKAEHNPG